MLRNFFVWQDVCVKMMLRDPHKPEDHGFSPVVVLQSPFSRLGAAFHSYMYPYGLDVHSRVLLCHS